MNIIIHRSTGQRAAEASRYLKSRFEECAYGRDTIMTNGGLCFHTMDKKLRIRIYYGDISKLVGVMPPDYYSADTSEARIQLAQLASKCDGKEVGGLFSIWNIINQHMEQPKKVYLTTHNPYMSEDWKKKFLEACQLPNIWNTDVRSMYPTFTPVRHHGESFYKGLLNEFYGKPKSPGVEAVRSRLATDLAEETEKKKRENGFNATQYILDEFHIPEEEWKKHRDELDTMWYSFNSLMIKEKEKENMNYLANELNKTNGAAILEVSGNRYKARVFDITMKSGEVTTLNVGVDDTPNNFLRTTREPVTRRALPAIKDVIFNDPATIVFWADGTKTVVKAQDEAFDPEKGLAMAISKKALGNQGRYFETFKKWLPEKEEVCE